MQAIQRFFAWFSNQGIFRKLALGCLSLFIVCCFCGVLLVIMTPSTPNSGVKNPSVTEVVSTPFTTQTDKPTHTLIPIFTKTPILTNTANLFFTPPSATLTSTATNTLPPTNTPTITRTPLPSNTPSPRYVPLIGKIWLGVKVYFGVGSEKAYGFEILGGSEDCPSLPSGRGIRVLYLDGTEEWKDREYLVNSGIFFVLDNDPAISKQEWFVYSFCP